MLRFIHVVAIVFKYSWILLLIKLNFYRKPRQKLLRNFFEEAGGSFIKFGQILSLRIDILPKEYSIELLDMLDRVKPVSYEEVKLVFRRELGALPEEIFDQFETEPFASASFGQVHKASLANNSLAVKVMRPGIEDDLAVDFVLINFLARITDIFFKVEAMPWIETAHEFKRWTSLEMNYHNEADNTERFYHSQKNPNVAIPKVFRRYSTRRILVQEFIEGIPLSNILRGLKDGSLSAEDLLRDNIDIKKVPRLLTEELLREYFFNGFYHADPHPGNVLIMPNDKIGLVDFGILGKAVPNQTSMVGMFRGMGEYDFRTAGYHLINFAGSELKQIAESAFPANISADEVDQFVHKLADRFYISIEGKVKQGLGDLRSMKTDHLAFLMRFAKEAESYRIRLPLEMVGFFRALAILGFMSKEMDFEFKFAEEMKRFFAKYDEKDFMSSTYNPQVKRMDRALAVERLTSWLSFLIERDPDLYQVVNSELSRYNVL